MSVYGCSRDKDDGIHISNVHNNPPPKINPRHIHSGMDSNIKWRVDMQWSTTEPWKMSELQLHATAWMGVIHVLELVSTVLIKRSQTLMQRQFHMCKVHKSGNLSYCVYQFILGWDKCREK